MPSVKVSRVVLKFKVSTPSSLVVAVNMVTFGFALSQMRLVKALNSLMKLRVVWFLRNIAQP